MGGPHMFATAGGRAAQEGGPTGIHRSFGPERAPSAFIHGFQFVGSSIFSLAQPD